MSLRDIMGRRELLVAVMVICAVITFINYIIVNPVIDKTSVAITSWASIVSLFAVGLGAIVTIRHHALNVLKKRKDWIWSIWLIFCTLATYVIGIVLTTGSDIYSWLFRNVLGSLSTTTASLVGLFCFTAAYRAFKVRTWDATILLVSALIIIIGRNIPLGQMISPSLPALANWLMDFPNTGANRGIRFIMAIVATGYGLRILVGRERGA